MSTIHKLSSPSLSPASAGFTLIEMLVAIVIMIMVIGGGIAGYVNLNDRQSLVNSGKEVELMMRSAQKKARVGERPTGCARLLSYEVRIQASNLSVAELSAICDDSTHVKQTLTMPTGVSAENAFQVRFNVLQGGVQGAGDIAIISSSRKYTFTVDAGGGISTGILTNKTQ